MLRETDVKKRIAEILIGKGFNVIASEATKGFTKPAMFVNVYPSTITRLCSGLTETEDTIEIKYIPAIETVEECAFVAEEMKQIFLYSPLQIKDRKLTVESMEFDIEKYVLYVYFDIKYIQEIENNEEYEEMTNLEIVGDI